MDPLSGKSGAPQGYLPAHLAGDCDCWCRVCAVQRAAQARLAGIEHSGQWDAGSFEMQGEQIAARQEAAWQVEEDRRQARWARRQDRLARLAAETAPALVAFEEQILGRHGTRLALTSGTGQELAVRGAPPGELEAWVSWERPVVAEVSDVELALALHGSRKELREHFRLVKSVRGYSAALLSANTIDAERKTRQLHSLRAQNRLINDSDPGGRGSDAERAAALLVLIADLSRDSLEDLGDLGLGCLYRWGSSLWEWDPAASPPCRVVSDHPARLRDALTRLHKAYYGDYANIWRRNPDKPVTDYDSVDQPPEPRDRNGSAFWVDEKGAWRCGKHRLTQLELRQLNEEILSEPLRGHVTWIPDVERIEPLAVFTDAELAAAGKVGKFPGVPDRAEVQQRFADRGGEGVFWSARPERAQRALEGGRPALEMMSLAEKIAAVAPWRGSMAELAAEIGFHGKPQSLSVQVKKLRGELLALGVIAEPTGGWCGPGGNREEWHVVKIIGAIEA